MRGVTQGPWHLQPNSDPEARCKVKSRKKLHKLVAHIMLGLVDDHEPPLRIANEEEAWHGSW